MLKRIRNVFGPGKGLSGEQFAILNRLPPDERRTQLGIVLHEICVKQAARFVEEEHRRADSPFRGIPRDDLFHEMLVMSYWVFAWLFRGKQPALMDRLHHHYVTSFVWGRDVVAPGVARRAARKFKAYDEAWDDYSGHQDVFARQAIGSIFGGRRTGEERQAAFWLITYADRAMKDFAKVTAAADLLLKDKAARS